MYNFLYLLFRKVLSNIVLINVLSALVLLSLDLLDAFTLDIASTDQHALESSEAEIVVTLGGQLLITQPGTEATDKFREISKINSLKANCTFFFSRT